LKLAGRAESLLKRAVVSSQKVIQRRKVVSALNGAGKQNVYSIVKKVHACLERMGAVLR
jgi:hypothetical protein